MRRSNLLRCFFSAFFLFFLHSYETVNAQLVGDLVCLPAGSPPASTPPLQCLREPCLDPPQLYGEGIIECANGNFIETEWDSSTSSTICCSTGAEVWGSGNLIVSAVSGFPGIAVGEIVGTGRSTSTGGIGTFSNAEFGIVDFEITPTSEVATHCEDLPNPLNTNMGASSGTWTSDVALSRVKIRYCERNCNSLEIDACAGTMTGHSVGNIALNQCETIEYEPTVGATFTSGSFDGSDTSLGQAYVTNVQPFYDIDDPIVQANRMFVSLLQNVPLARPWLMP